MKTEPKLNEKFGKWEVINVIPEMRNGQRYFEVKCECGLIDYKHWSSLRLGKTTQCKQCVNKSKRLNVNNGDVYKEYTVIDNTPIIKHQQTHIKVKCSCGNERLINISQLLNPNKYFKCKKCTDSFIEMDGKFRKSYINRLKLSASDRNIYFSDKLNSEYLWKLLENQNFKCALTGENLKLNNDNYNYDFTELPISLDRIDSTKSYEIGNVQWVLKQVNICKQILTNLEFIELCKKVVNYANQQPS